MENLRKVVFLCQMSEVGTDAWIFANVRADATEAELEALGAELAEDNAEMFGYSSYPNTELEEGEEDDSYDDSIGACMYEYVPELHDMHTTSGTPSWNNYY